MDMELKGEHAPLMAGEVARLQQRVKMALAGLLLLGLVSLGLLVGLIAVGVKQGHNIDDLKASNAQGSALDGGNKESANYAYGGSLFRGSGFWARKRDLPEPLTDFAAVGVGDFIYLLGGANATGDVTANVWKYDSLLHTYTAVAPLLSPRYRFGADVINGKIYIAGGFFNDSQPPLKTTEIYDTVTDTWARGADTIGFHGDTCAVAVNGKLYLTAGYGVDFAYVNETEEYDPVANRWTLKAPIPNKRGDLMCAALNGELYAVGGYYSESFTPDAFTTVVDSYNPVTDKWTSRAPMLTPRGDAAIAVLPNNRLIVVGGEGHARMNDSIKYPKHVNEVYYADDNVWVEKAMIPNARFRLSAASAGGLAFAFGGADLCPDANRFKCPAQSVVEVFLDVTHPRVYLYLKEQAVALGAAASGRNQAKVFAGVDAKI